VGSEKTPGGWMRVNKEVINESISVRSLFSEEIFTLGSRDKLLLLVNKSFKFKIKFIQL